MALDVLDGFGMTKREVVGDNPQDGMLLVRFMVVARTEAARTAVTIVEVRDPRDKTIVRILVEAFSVIEVVYNGEDEEVKDQGGARRSEEEEPKHAERKNGQ